MRKVKVKLCGMKTLQDIEIVNRYLPDFVGFVFAGEKRRVTFKQAQQMKLVLDKRIQAVGVFVNEPREHIIELCQQGMIDVVQLHGEETEDDIYALKQVISNPIIQVIKVPKDELPSDFTDRLSTAADYLLFDTAKLGVYGGSGECFSLQLLQTALEEYQKEQPLRPYFIAGGLTIENVAKPIRETNCYGIDLSSGIETQGKKEEEKVRELMQFLRT